MTKKKVDALKAGYKLDVLVAKKVMGAKVVKGRKGTYDLVIPGGTISSDWTSEAGAWCGCPRYSTDIADAWKMAEKVGLLKNCRHLHENGVGVQKDYKWTRTGWEWVVEEVLQPMGENTVLGRGETVPLAICRAALRLVMLRTE